MTGLHLITVVACLLVVLAGVIAVLGRQDSVLRLCAWWLFAFAVIFALLPMTWGCRNDVTGPSCHVVTQPKVSASQWTEINGRLVLVQITAPKVSTEVCE